MIGIRINKEVIFIILYNDSLNINIAFEPTAIENIKKEAAKYPNHETGGLLLGNFYEFSIYVGYSFGPFPDSVHDSANFELGVDGLKELQDKMWDEKEVGYVGEWHSHPNNSSNPSSIDDDILLGYSRNADHPIILLIIGGNEKSGYEFSVNLYRDNEKFIFKNRNN